MIDRLIALTVLRILHECSGYALPEETLFQQLNLSLPKPITMSWLREHLQHARDQGWAAIKTDAIDRREKYYITEKGKIILGDA